MNINVIAFALTSAACFMFGFVCASLLYRSSIDYMLNVIEAWRTTYDRRLGTTTLLEIRQGREEKGNERDITIN